MKRSTTPFTYAVTFMLFLSVQVCGQPQGPSSADQPTPTLAYKALFEAVKKKDPEAIKKMLSKGTLEMMETYASIQKKTIDKVVENGLTETTFASNLPETRNERTWGDLAILEVKNEKKGTWEALPFARENGNWKLAIDTYFNGTMSPAGPTNPENPGELPRNAQLDPRPTLPQVKPSPSEQDASPRNPGAATPSSSPESTQDPQRVDRPPVGFDRSQGQARALTIDEAIALSLIQASIYQQSQIDERISAEDVKQARAGLYPQFTVPLSYFGTTPSRYRLEDEPVTFSYVSSSAIHETTAFFQASGEIDISGRLRATLRRSRYLLDAAKAGTLAARRALALNTIDAYYNLVLARQRRRLAEETLSLAEGFVKVVQGREQRGEDESEGADGMRARSQVATRRDELEQARAAESAGADLLRVLIGVNFTTQIDVTRIAQDLPTTSDFASYTEEMLRSRPELAQIDAQKLAAKAEASSARRERLPQLSYTVNGGFDAGDFRPLTRYSGGSALVSLTIPIFDFGASKSREAQARLRTQSLDLQRELTVRLLQQEFYTARATALAALTRIRETEAGASEAQKNMMLVLTQYRLKKANITDVVDAQAAYADARMAYFQAIIDYRTARYRLEQDLGK